jgi:hypothetical protein
MSFELRESSGYTVKEAVDKSWPISIYNEDDDI